MQKVGIVTLYGNYNYGNKLQNYAMQVIFERLGYKVITINSETKKYGFNLKMFFKYILGMLGCRHFATDRMYFLNMKREKLFEKFSSKYLHVVNIKSKSDAKKLVDIDLFIVGSDQVWNDWGLDKENLNYYFLQFTDFNKRLAVSPSFGIKEIKQELRQTYINGLSGFNILSCREEEGKNLINKLVNTECVVLVDPTMILDKSDWLKIVQESPLDIQRKYILLYFLGEITQEYKYFIKSLANKNDLNVVILMDSNNPQSFLINPGQFIQLLKNAEIVCTDSFHGTAFSILFERPFVVFNRTGMGGVMNSRIKTLLNCFNFNNREYSQIKEDELYNISFSESKNILRTKRREFYQYIDRAITLNKQNGAQGCGNQLKVL